jgi:hypothetical protein
MDSFFQCQESKFSPIGPSPQKKHLIEKIWTLFVRRRFWEHLKMHKICILGNSHVASLKQGWEQIKGSWPRVEVSFFAQAGVEGLHSVFVDGYHLTSRKSNARESFVLTHGEERMDIWKYDSFLIYGAKSRNYWPGNTFYSMSCLKSVIEDLTCGTPAQHVLSCLREVSEAPIFIGHSPLRAAKII